jgi:DNA-directed RNA polymerase subunit alpha
MRVGDRTDFNRLRILIETNGTLSPREALERSIETMIHQLKSVIGFQEESESSDSSESMGATQVVGATPSKLKIDEMGLSGRTASALADGGVKTVAGLIRKSASALKELDGVGDKAITEITEALEKLGLELKAD